MERFNLGELVTGEGVGSGALYRGHVVRTYSTYGECKIRVTEVLRGLGQRVGSEANIKNVKRSTEMANGKNLIGPKPEPAQEPKFVAPFHNDGRNVVDTNGKVVFRIQFGGYTTSAYRSELPVAEGYELARVVAEALTAKFEKAVGETKSPF